MHQPKLLNLLIGCPRIMPDESDVTATLSGRCWGLAIQLHQVTRSKMTLMSHCSKPVRPTFHQTDDPCPVALRKVLTRPALNDSGSDPLVVDGFDQIVIRSFAIDR